jgi:polyhydroxyalkanoate synthesis regulator phasin
MWLAGIEALDSARQSLNGATREEFDALSRQVSDLKARLETR